MAGHEIKQVWVDEYNHADDAFRFVLGAQKMSFSEEQFIDMGKAAMSALITCHNSVLVSPEEIAEKAWAMADAMSSAHTTLTQRSMTASDASRAAQLAALRAIQPHIFRSPLAMPEAGDTFDTVKIRRPGDSK
jgi:hypothetical protein